MNETESAFRGTAPHPGMKIGDRYHLEALIAHGGMGSVFEAWDAILERIVAIKLMRNDYATDAGLVERFLGEARAAAALRSAHVINILDVGQLPSGVPFMVMERLEGFDLHQRIEHAGRVPTEQACQFAIDACSALAEAHRAGVVHRDIKPENLFVATLGSGKSILKVIDFGIAKRPPSASSRALTSAGESIGSPAYMAPEQMIDPRTVDGRADIWSLGATLFHAVTGQTPFDAETIPEMCSKVLTWAPRRPSELSETPLPAGLEAVILRCLEKDPAHRYQSVEELAAALTPFADPWQGESRVSRTPAPVVPSAAPATKRYEEELPAVRRGLGDSSLPEAATFTPAHELARYEKRSSVGTWLASLAIVALGVALFVTWPSWRSLTDGWLTPVPLGEVAFEPAHRTAAEPRTWVLSPRGVFGVRAAGFDGLVAEPQISGLPEQGGGESERESARDATAERDSTERQPGQLSPGEIERRKRAYREYLQKEGLRPLDEVLEEVD